VELTKDIGELRDDVSEERTPASALAFVGSPTTPESVYSVNERYLESGPLSNYVVDAAFVWLVSILGDVPVFVDGSGLQWSMSDVSNSPAWLIPPVSV